MPNKLLLQCLAQFRPRMQMLSKKSGCRCTRVRNCRQEKKGRETSNPHPPLMRPTVLPNATPPIWRCFSRHSANCDSEFSSRSLAVRCFCHVNYKFFICVAAGELGPLFSVVSIVFSLREIVNRKINTGNG